MPRAAWSTQQLVEFVAAVSAAESEVSAAVAAVVRATEALDADVAAIVCGGEVVAAVGYPDGSAPVGELEAVEPGMVGSLAVPGVGECSTAAAALDHPPGATLVIARRGPDGLTREENELLRGMALVVSVLMRSQRVLDDERVSREELDRLAREQAALCRIATLVARATPLTEVFAAVVAEVRSLFSADVTGVARFDANDTMTVVAGWSAAGAAPAIGLRGSGVAVPITVEGRSWGMLAVASTGDEPPPAGTEARVAAFAELVATAIASAEAHAELTASRARIIAAADETRRDIERRLHEGAQQRLVALALNLRIAQSSVPPELAELSAELDNVGRGLTSALDELREFARWIHPASLAERGLGRAVKALAQRSAVPVGLDVRTDARFPERVEVAAYYVVYEALANAAKHANATAVAIDLHATDALLRISIRDDGRGGASFAHGSGLVGLKDRVEALGGRISLDSPVGAGTSLSVELPLARDSGSSQPANAATAQQ